MREKIHTFGPTGGMIGIMTEPDAGVLRPGSPVVLASNVGLNHRVGPYRFYVDLARELALIGYRMFRFDLSGLGDSAPRRDGSDEFDRANLDVHDAMELLAKRYGAQTFIQLGFCSGVDSAHAMSMADARVVGMINIEGYSFGTPGFYARRYLKRPLSRRFWRFYVERTVVAPARRVLEPLVGGKPDPMREAGESLEIYTRSYPTRDQLLHDYSALAARGVHMLLAYSGGAEHAYNYRKQFEHMFPELKNEPHIEVEFLPHADHVYTSMLDRTQLLRRITGWMLVHYPQNAVSSNSK